MTPASHRVRPLVALRALRALIRDPDDTSQVFVLIAALAGRSRGYVLSRLAATPGSRRLIHGRPPLSATLSDRAALAAMPEGSLGRAYLAFCERAGITADGLVAASAPGELEELTEDERRYADRLRDMHDLWHVVTGYQTDLVGEASILAFTLAQTRNRGIAAIVLAALAEFRGERAHGRKPIVQAFRRGLSAAWLPAVDWEAELPRPLSEVRARLGVGSAPAYEPIWSDGAAPKAA